MPWWAALLMTGLVLTVLMLPVTVLAVLVHMHEQHGVAIHWKCNGEEEPPDDGYYHSQNWERS